MQLTVGVERETDGRWIAAVDPIGALAYGTTRAEAIRKAKAVALEVIARVLAPPDEGLKVDRRFAAASVRASSPRHISRPDP
jgi:predicted RNase H-like HicB family nuclease